MAKGLLDLRVHHGSTTAAVLRSLAPALLQLTVPVPAKGGGRSRTPSRGAPPLLPGFALPGVQLQIPIPPAIRAVKFGPAPSGAQQLDALSAVLSRAWSVTKLALRGSGVSAAGFDAFVAGSVAGGGCSQVADLNLANNPGIADSNLGRTLRTWPRVPVLDLLASGSHWQ